MLFSFDSDWSWVFNLWINSSFRCIIDPFTNKYLIFFTKEIWSLTFSLIIDPMTFEMISTTLGKHSISASFSHVPHTFIDISVRVYHSSLSVRKVVHPHTIIPISRFIEHSASALFWVIFPVSSVLSSEFVLGISYPICTLTMTFVLGPSSFVLISVGIILNTETFFLIVFPVTNILVRSFPFVRLFATIFV